MSYFTINIEHFIIKFSMVYYAIAMGTIMWNIANLRRSSQQVFFAPMASYTVWYDVIYHPFPINSKYLKTLGADSPVMYRTRVWIITYSNTWTGSGYQSGGNCHEVLFLISSTTDMDSRTILLFCKWLVQNTGHRSGVQLTSTNYFVMDLKNVFG